MAAPTQPANVKKSLANSEPSTHGTKRTNRGKRSLVRFWSEADMPRAAGACRSYENDPKRTKTGMKTPTAADARPLVGSTDPEARICFLPFRRVGRRRLRRACRWRCRRPDHEGRCAVAVDDGLRAPRGSHAGARLRTDTRRCHDRVRQELAAGVSTAEWLLYLAPMIRAGLLHVPFGTGRHAPITAEDQARVIVGIVENPSQHGGKTYPLYGPVEFTYQGIANVLSRVLGKEVQYKQVSIETMLQ